MSGLIHKRKSVLIALFNWIYSDTSRYIITLFSLTSLFLMGNFVTGLKTATFLFMFLAFIINIKIKNIFISFFIVSIYVFALINPNKSYSVLVFKSVARNWSSGFDYFMEYGLNLSNIFLVLTSVACIREVIITKKAVKIPSNEFRILFLSSLGFFLTALSSSIKSSPFLIPSFVWILQYMQLFLVAFLLVLWKVNYQNKFRYFYDITVFSILFQGVIAFMQFAGQSDLGLLIESRNMASYFNQGADQVNAFFRVYGTFQFANELALIMSVMMFILLPYTLQKRKPYHIIAILTVIIIVVLTQSRATWIALAIVLYTLTKIKKQMLNSLLNKTSKIRLLVYSSSIILILSIVVLPRITLSFNLFSEFGGGELRKKMITEALEAILRNPLIGYGAGTNVYVLQSLFPEGIMSLFPAPVHMAFIQMILEFGILGVIFFWTPFIYTARNLLRQSAYTFPKKQIKKYSFALGLFTVVLYYLFHTHNGIVEFSYLGLLLGFGMSSNQLNKQR